MLLSTLTVLRYSCSLPPPLALSEVQSKLKQPAWPRDEEQAVKRKPVVKVNWGWVSLHAGHHFCPASVAPLPWVPFRAHDLTQSSEGRPVAP